MTATATAVRPRVVDLLMVRLLVPGKKPPQPGVLRQQLGQLFGEPPSAEELDAALSELAAAGLVTLKPRQLTEAGRARALEFLGVTELPPRSNWKAIVARYLVPKALGLSAEAARKLGKADALRAYLVRQRFGLPPGGTIRQAMDALACRELGFPGEANLEQVERAVLSKLLGFDERLSFEHLEKQLPRVAVDARGTGADDLRRAILARWAADGTGARPVAPEPVTEPGPPAAEFDLPTFAATVRALARACPAGRFGDNKVFIAAVWRQSQAEANFPRLTLDEFKARLVQAHRAGLLQLSRADLVQAMDPAAVAESEVPYLNATFHFVLLDEARP